MIKQYIILWFILLPMGLLTAQNCGLEDTLLINTNSNQVFTFNMFDAVNDNLGDPDQGICGVELEFVHQFSENLELWLVSPDNDTVKLIGDNTADQLAFTFFANWNITFVPCADVAMPDSSYVAQWNNDQPNNFVSGGMYNGSYYPFNGCLEDFDSGQVNGPWTILVNNGPSDYAGAILNMRLILCDPRGLDCCFADAGNLINDPDILACEGSDTLNLAPIPFYDFGTPPDTLEYGYTYVIGQDGILIDYDSLTDLTAYSAGNYQVCGFSYKRTDLDSFPLPDGQLTLDSLRNNLNSDSPAFCGAVSDTCINVIIVAPPIPTDLTFDICEGDTLFVADTSFTMTGNYSLTLESFAGCDSVLNINLTVNEVLAVSLDSTICLGDSVVVGSSTYFDTGIYTDSLQSLAGCDSVVTLDLEVLAPVDTILMPTICLGDTVFVDDMPFFETGNYQIDLLSTQGCDSTVFLELTVLTVEAVIAPPDTITCFNNGITLDGNASSPSGAIDYTWSELSGGVLGTDPTYFLSAGDTIILTVEQQSGSTICMSSDTVIVVENTTLPVADAGQTDTLNCSITSLSVGSPNTSQGINYVYAWTTNTGHFVSDTFGLMPIVDAPGDYTLLVTDTQNGCTQTAIVTVTQDIEIPIADAGPDQFLTCTNPSVQLDGSASSQGGVFDYNWTSFNGVVIQNGDTPTPTVTEPDSFRLLVVNTENNCLDSSFVAVFRNDTLPEVVIADPGVLNCGITSLQLDATASDNGPIYDFNWIVSNGGNISAGENTLTPSIDATGIYQLVVTNNLIGCQGSAIVVVQDTINTIMANPGQPDTLTCLVDTVLLDATASSSGVDILYCWSTLDGHFAADSLVAQTMVDRPGTYQLIVKDTFTLCADTAIVEVFIDTIPPLADAGTGFRINCETTQDTLFGNGELMETANLSYLWTGPCILSDPDSSWVVVDCAGVYFFTVIDTETGCMATDSTIVDQNMTFPVADAGPERLLNCIDTTTILDGSASVPSGLILFEWTGPGLISDQDSANPVVNQAGIYTLIITDLQSQCKDTAQVSVGLDNNPPMADPGDQMTIDCNNPFAEIGGTNTSGGPNFIYEWITNEGHFISSTNLPTATVDTSGLYVLFVTDTLNGCQDTAFATVISNLERPFVNAGPNFELDCGTDTVFLDGSNSATGDQFIYQWTGPCLGEPTDSIMVSASCPGTYVLSLTDTENGCINTDSVVISLNPQAPVAMLPDTAFIACQTGMVVLDGSSSSPGDYQWLFNGNPTVLNGLMPMVDSAGVYTLVVSSLDFSCTDSADIVVILDCTPTVVLADPDTITCAREIVTLDASASTGGQNLTFQWATDNNPACILGSANNPSIQVNCAGVYTVIVTNEAIQLSDTLSVMVPIDTIKPQAEAGLRDTITCSQPIAILDGSGSNTGSDIIALWTNSDDDTIGYNWVEMVSEPGSYFLEIRDTSNGCSSVDLVQITENIVIPNINFGNFVFPCDRDTFGLASFVTPLNASYDYEWTGPGIVANADSSMVQVNALGTYFLMVTNNLNGCSEVDSVTVVDQTCAPCIEVLPPDTLTCNVNSVELVGSFCLDCVNCTVAWTTEDGTPIPGGDALSVSVIESGIYRITATDTMGFSTTLQLEVFENLQVPETDAGPDRMLTCDSLSVVLGGPSTVVGSQFLYQWTTETGNSPNPMDQSYTTTDTDGTYILLVTDTLTGCFGMDTVLVGQDTLPPIANAGPDKSLTCTMGIVTLNGENSSINGPYFYQWATDNGSNIVGANSLNPLVNMQGDYWISVRDTLNGCIAVDSVQVILSDDVPTIPPIADITLTCQETTTILEAMLIDTSGYSFAWCQLDAAGMPIPASCKDSLAITVDTPGSYVFRITNDATGCSSIEQVEVLENIDPPTVNAGADAILICSEESLDLNGLAEPATANLSYQWTSTAGGNIINPDSLIATITMADTFVLEVINLDNQCSARDTVVIGLDNNIPTASAGSDSLLSCTLTSLNLNGSGTTTSGLIEYLWSTPDGQFQSDSTQANPIINQPGMYILQVSDPNNNCSAVDTVIISEDTTAPEIMIEFPFGNVLTCDQDTIVIDASNSISNTASSLSYSWSISTVGHIIGENSNSFISLDSIGIYRLIITDSLNTCRDTMNFQIGANLQKPTVVLANPLPLTCSRETVSLNAIGSSMGDDFSLNWTDPTGTSLADTTSTPGVQMGGLYILTITNRATGCTKSDSLRVEYDTIPPLINIAEPDILDCTVRETEIDARASAQGENFTYMWTANPGAILSGENTTVARINGPGNYILSIANELNGCSSTDSITVMESASPIELVQYTVDPPGCNGELDGEIVIDTVIGGMGPYLFAFNNDFFSDRREYRNLAPGVYQLQIEDANGCDYAEEIDVSLGEELIVDLGADITIKLGDSIRLEAIVNLDYDSLVWGPSQAFNNPNLPVQYVSPVETSVYDVWVIDENDCIARDKIVVSVAKTRDIFIPNVFSPNGDGQNDVFMIFASDEVSEIRFFKIFDRWGNQVHGKESFQPNDPAYGWDGNFDGRPMNAAVFAFFVEVEFIDGRVEMIKGDVVLMR